MNLLLCLFLTYLLVCFFSMGTWTKETARRPARPWSFKLNPKNLRWLWIENDDDGELGPPNWKPPIKKEWKFEKKRIGSIFGKDLFFWVVRKVEIPESINDPKWRARAWWWRNPAHNLTFYVLGFADRDRIYFCKWPGGRFHRPGGGFLCGTTWVKLGPLGLLLPFVSFISPYAKLYIGWRPSGAFGLKGNFSIAGKIEVG